MAYQDKRRINGLVGPVVRTAGRLWWVYALVLLTGTVSRPALAASVEDPVAVADWTLPQASRATEPVDPVSYGPAALPDQAPAALPDPRYDSFGRQAGAVKWEVGGILAYMTVTQALVTKETRSFHFQDEGWFGKDTTNLGVDKLTHAFNSYLLTELLTARIERKAGPVPGAAVTAAALASGLMIYSELWDAHKVSSGFSPQDVLFNTGGAALSILRHTVPGLKQKLDFRLLLIPNSDIITLKGKRHYEQQRFMFALKLAGFDSMAQSPARFVELHAGYRASGFTNEDRARGAPLRRRIFVGVGVNLKDLFFPNPRSILGRAARTTLDYIQIPYTAVHID